MRRSPRYRSTPLVLAAMTLAVAVVSAHAQESQDTAKAVPLREVTVRSEGAAAAAASSVRPMTIVDARAIDATGARDAADAAAMAPGVFVRQYGGYGGMRSAAIRGAAAQQTVLLIDGARYQSSAAGGFDLSNIPAAGLQRLEVIRGGDAATYGANALGGVINVVTEPIAAGTFGRASFDAGSFGERALGLSGCATAGPHSLNAAVSAAATGGDYPFDLDEYGSRSEVRRTNADFTNLFARLGWNWRAGDRTTVAASALAFSTDRGVPGAVVQGSHELAHARLNERDVFAVVRGATTADQWDLAAWATGRLNDVRYRDPDARLVSADGIDNAYARREIALTLRGRRPIGDAGLLTLSTDVVHAQLAGDNLDPSAQGSVRRTQGGAAAALEWSWDEVASWLDVTAEAALRADTFSDLPGAISPSVGALLRLRDAPIRLRAHTALNYRAPSFTEQYYLNLGNTDLVPERSWSLSAGLAWVPVPTLTVELSAFQISTRDQIVAVPRSPVSWSARNVAAVLSRGMELSLSGTVLDGRIAAGMSYTLMRAEDRSGGEEHGMQLVYTPQELGSGYLEVRPGSLSLGINWSFASHRHTLPSNSAESVLPGYAVVGVRGSLRAQLAGLDVLLRLELANLFDADYQVIRHYPMPGRSLRAGVEVAFND